MSPVPGLNAGLPMIGDVNLFIHDLEHPESAEIEVRQSYPRWADQSHCSSPHGLCHVQV